MQRLAEVGVREAGSARVAHRSQPTSSVSEEAAIYAKRLKTLCELLWDDRISLDTYREASNEAYEAYRRSASQRQRVLLPVP